MMILMPCAGIAGIGVVASVTPHAAVINANPSKSAIRCCSVCEQSGILEATVMLLLIQWEKSLVIPVFADCCRRVTSEVLQNMAGTSLCLHLTQCGGIFL